MWTADSERVLENPTTKSACMHSDPREESNCGWAAEDR